MGLFSTNKSSSVVNQTDHHFYDQRSVTDAGGGIVGSWNKVDTSSHLTDARGGIAGNWNRVDTSSHMYDARGGVVGSGNIVTDGGAFTLVGQVADGINRIGLAQVDAARSIAASGNSMGTEAARLATAAQERAFGFNELAAGKAFDLAKSSQAGAWDAFADLQGMAKSSQAGAWDAFGDVLGMAKDVTNTAKDQAAQAASVAQAAYQGAADTASGNKTLIYAAIGAVALVGLAVAFKS